MAALSGLILAPAPHFFRQSNTRNVMDVVRVVVFYPDEPGSNPAEVYNYFFSKMV